MDLVGRSCGLRGDREIFIFSFSQMIWLLLCLSSFANGSEVQRSYFPSSSVPNMGAGVASSFFSLSPTKVSFPILERVAEVIGRRNEGNEFILVLLRLLGVDIEKVKDLAFDGMVSLVHLLGQTVLKDGGKVRMGRRARRNLSLFHYILHRPQIADLLKQMQDPKLVDSLLKESTEKLKNSEEDAECILLLICKTNPFVLGMQRSLKFFMNREGMRASGDEACPEDGKEEICHGGDEDDAWEKTNPEGRMYFFFPSLGEVIAHGDMCDQLFPSCDY